MRWSIFFVLLMASFARADVGVLVLKDGIVIAKEVYIGETKDLQDKLNKRTAADPTFTFTALPFDVKADAVQFETTPIPGEIAKKNERDQAILDAKDKNKTTAERLDALIKVTLP